MLLVAAFAYGLPAAEAGSVSDVGDNATDRTNGTQADRLGSGVDGSNASQPNGTTEAAGPHSAGSGAANTGDQPAASSSGTPAFEDQVNSSLAWLGAHGGWLVGLVAAVGVGGAYTRRSRPQPDPDESEPALQAAVEHPGPEGALMLGRRALRKGEPEVAGAWFAAAHELGDQLAIAAMCRGLCHLELDDPRQARAWLSRAVDLDPKDGTARYQLARAQAIDGAKRDALRTLRPLVELRPGLVEDVSSDPVFEDLRQLPGWLSLVEELARSRSKT